MTDSFVDAGSTGSDTGYSDTGYNDEGTREDAGTGIGGHTFDGEPAARREEAPAPQAPSKYKIKADGAEHEFTLEELQRHASLGLGAQKRMQEAAQQRKQIEDVVMTLKSNPAAAFKALGIDPGQWAESYLGEQIEQRVDPENYKRKQELKELADFKKQRELAMRQHQQQQIMAVKQQDQQKLMTEISEAFNQSGFVQDDKARAYKAYHALKMIASDRIKASREGREPSMTISDALKRTDDLLNRNFIGYISTLPGDKMAELLGEENLKRIRKYDVDRFRKGTQAVPGQGERNTAPIAKPKAPTGTGYLNENEWRAKMARLRG